MGWVFLIGFVMATFAGLWVSKRCSRMALELAAAALLVGVVGYAWQGSPSMAGQAPVPVAK
jgi:cytochrome c-type biogenesis protein CcmH